MSHATVRATNLPDIIDLIRQNTQMSENDALDAFYTSATGKSFADDDTGLYGQSALYVYGLYLEEQRNKAHVSGGKCEKIGDDSTSSVSSAGHANH